MNPLWPTIVAVAILLFFAVVVLAAMRQYTFEQTMKIWQAEVGLLGTIIGMIGTFFFAQVSISNLTEARDTAQLQTQQALATTEELGQARQQIADKLIQRDNELRVAKQEGVRFREQLARAEEKWDSFNTSFSKPEFRTAVFNAYTATEPGMLDITKLMDRFSGEDSALDIAHTPGPAPEKDKG